MRPLGVVSKNDIGASNTLQIPAKNQHVAPGIRGEKSGKSREVHRKNVAKADKMQKSR